MSTNATRPKGGTATAADASKPDEAAPLPALKAEVIATFPMLEPGRDAVFGRRCFDACRELIDPCRQLIELLADRCERAFQARGIRRCGVSERRQIFGELVHLRFKLISGGGLTAGLLEQLLETHRREGAGAAVLSF